eukprot:TRINITY_DN6482_c0_g2_i1.p1 TRINITY_DN6482_c0_g2~~TRINITY_DN6482_c0_g2_i1.p1  ORF type:complete len:198 (+),score=39.30 TRINITY_DN6482_c0_g2_i1:59-595(+)
MGAVFVGNEYHTLLKLNQEYGLTDKIRLPHVHVTTFADDTAPEITLCQDILKATYSKILSGAIAVPPSVLKSNDSVYITNYAVRQAALIYNTWYKKAFPSHCKYRFCFERINKEVLSKISTSFGIFLRSNKMKALEPFMQHMFALTGYGRLDSTPAYYGLMLISPDLLLHCGEVYSSS